LGYEDGRNVRLVLRSAEAHLERLPGLVAELVQMKADVIVALNTPAARVAIDATKEIPIAIFVGDPIGSGFVSNLAHPGGNVTGVSTFASELAAKRLQLLKELLPSMGRVAVLFNPDDPLTVPQRRETERAAPRVGVEVRFFPVPSQDRLTAAFQESIDWHAGGLFWLLGQERPFIPRTIDLAAKHRLPAMAPRREQVEAGGLICYYPVYSELSRRLSVQVDKILKGGAPGDLPVEQPTKFELVINMKTAKVLGLTVPQALLVRADKVIE
jgi:putative ABC transport system substrate-binding protein